jgi:hypothetical protein
MQRNDALFVSRGDQSVLELNRARLVSEPLSERRFRIALIDELAD